MRFMSIFLLFFLKYIFQNEKRFVYIYIATNNWLKVNFSLNSSSVHIIAPNERHVKYFLFPLHMQEFNITVNLF